MYFMCSHWNWFEKQIFSFNNNKKNLSTKIVFWTIYKSLILPFDLSPKGMPQHCQRSFGKRPSGHRKGYEMPKATFPPLLKATAGTGRRLRSTSPSNSGDPEEKSNKVLPMWWEKAAAVTRGQGNIIILSRSLLIIGRMDILDYAPKIKLWIRVETKSKLGTFQKQVLQPVTTVAGFEFLSPVYPSVILVNWKCAAKANLLSNMLQQLLLVMIEMLQQCLLKHPGNFTAHLILFVQVRTDIDATQHEEK